MTETTSLYNGEVLCEFNSARHSYTIVIKGRRYKVPSVTRITSVLDKSGPLVNWAINSTLDVCKGAIAPGTEYAETYLEAVWQAAKQQSRSLKDEAAARGKGLHKRIEASLSGSDEQGIDDIQGTNLRDFLRRNTLAPKEIERRIYSRRYRYSGTFDGLFESEGSLYLIDWKTSKSIYPEFRLQTAAYVHAWEEEHPDQKIEGRYLVRIAEDGSIEPHFFERKTLSKDFQAFLGALELFNGIQRIEKESRKALKAKELK